MARKEDSLEKVGLELVSKVLRLQERLKEETSRLEKQYIQGQIDAYATAKNRIDLLSERISNG